MWGTDSPTYSKNIMPSIRIIPQTNEVYHVYNRGVDKRDIFMDRADRIRFLHDLYEFNDNNFAPDFDRRYQPIKNVGESVPHIKIRPRESIVDILAFCLMDNHYHLLLRQKTDNGISAFMKKLNAGYACAFNLKHDRSGHLMQGRYRAKHVDTDEYFRHLICYIHFNPVNKILEKNRKININRVWEKLGKYRWSSHLDYLGEDNFSSILNKQSMGDVFGSISEYKKFAKGWLKCYDKNVNIVDSVAIDLK